VTSEDEGAEGPEDEGGGGGGVGGRGVLDYPVVLSVAGRPCLVVGAGPVGARRARGLLECGAELTVVAPRAGTAMESLLRSTPPERLRLERRRYRDGEASAYDVVVVATGDPSVDRQVAEDALAAGALAVGPVSSSVRAVHLPAVHRAGAVTVAVSTAGRSPALSAWLRQRLGPAVGPHLAEVAELVADARRSMRSSGRRPEEVDWHALLDLVVPLVEAGRLEEARDLLGQLG